MKLTLTLIFIPLLLITACQNKPNKRPLDYKLIEESGIYVEQFDSTNVNENRYTSNNLTFKEGVQFTYSFNHITSDGNMLYFQDDNNIADWEYAWKFVPSDSVDENTIRKVIITVKYGLQPFIKNIPDYNQTIIKYEYPTDVGNSSFNSVSGVIENENNIWMHPPRDKYFRILELNPFPFIKTPYEIGNKWNWSLKIGSSWGDERWKTWDGGIENQYDYEIIDKRKIQTKLGEIDCYVIESKAKSKIGETELKAFFNPEYGFVRLNYINIDGTKTNLELIEHSEKKNSK